MADVIDALVALLKADASVAALAGTRVFGGELPPTETAAMPRSALLVKPTGGASLTGSSYARADTQRIDLRGYGATPAEAAAMLQAGANALRTARRKLWAGILVHVINSAGGFSTERDPGTLWPRAIQSFQVFHALGPI